MLSLPVANIPHGVGELDCSAHPIPQARISVLRVEHDDLDSAIGALIKANTHDDLIVTRLKKRKLQIADEIAGLMAAVQMRNAGPSAEAIPVFQSDADIAALAPFALGAVTPAPKAGGASSIIGVSATLAVLLMLGMGWSGMLDSLNQTIAQIALLSLLVAANG